MILDELLNTLTLGSPDETISSRSEKARNKGKAWGCVMCKFLNIFQKEHCNKSLIIDRGEDAILKD